MTAETVYLDHAATTPMRPEAVAALTGELAPVGNASSLHAAGRRARRVLEESRETLARSLGARPSEVVFTSGGTEADNLAVKGLYWARRAADPRRRRIIASPVEHHAVLDSVRWLAAHEDARIDWLPVDGHGLVHPAALREALSADPGSAALVTVMWANNEVGTIQPVRELADIAHEYGVPIHSDGVQAFGAVPVDFTASGLDALSVSAHKVGGPHGIGALVLARTATPVPVLHGGGQERDVRSGTMPVPAIASFAAAARLAADEQPDSAARLAELRADLVTRVNAAVPTAVLNGHPDAACRLPGIAHFSFPGCEGDSLLFLLDARGIACSTGSACTAGVAQPSHVLLAMGADDQRARGSLRFSLGHTSTPADVSALAAAIGPVVERARAAGLSVPSRT